MNFRNRFLAISAIALLLICLAGCTGCLHNPAVPVTPAQQVQLTLNQSLSVVSTLNKSVAQDVIGLNAQGILSKDLTNSILSWQRAIAVQILAAETVQSSTQTDAQKAVAIKNAFSTFNLPADIKALLDSPQSDAAVKGLVTTIQSIVALVRSLQGA
jgi:hypothetical protein